MNLFAEKLDHLAATVSLAASQDHGALACAMTARGPGFATAVGSGGSAITASYFAACRRTLGFGPTWVTTPADFVLTGENATGGAVWLFSGSGDNTDIVAAYDRATAMRIPDLFVLTSRKDGELGHRATKDLFLAACGAEKDGFLATHTLAAGMTALLTAADLAAGGQGASPGQRLAAAAAGVLDPEARARVAEALSSLRLTDSLFVLHDPRLAPAALAIETSAWEAALCPVQRVDFRNFAHGRHVWAAHRPGNVFVLALTSFETRAMWSEIEARLPAAVRRLELDAGGCGRFATAVSVFSALAVVEGMGKALGVDPARPGVSDFGRDLFASGSLQDMVRRLPAPLRAKRLAVDKYDSQDAAQLDLEACHAAIRATWAETPISGLVLDFDGTLVATHARTRPIGREIGVALRRLISQGLRLGIATGRGGSASHQLRRTLTKSIQGDVLIGYYNGACILPLDQDLETSRPPVAPEISAAVAWLTSVYGLAAEKIHNSCVQLTLQRTDVPDVGALDEALRSAGCSGLRLVQSGHTVDICLAATCKTLVVAALASRWGLDDSSILRVGDSGAPQGNDHDLLGSEMGVSVGELCGRARQGWPMFGPPIAGPDAVLRLLLALRPTEPGRFQIDLDALDAVD